MDYDSIIRHICDVFNRNSVEYLLVGGTAVSLHGYHRPSRTPDGQVVDKPDLDFWYNPSYENYFKLLDAFEELGRDVTKYRAATTPNPRESVFKYEFDNYTLDVLPYIKAPLKFGVSFARKRVFKSQGIEILLINLEDLIQDKEALGRPKDISDIENLRSANS